MPLTILFFGSLADICACRSLEIAGFGNTDELLHHLFQQFPLLKAQSFRIALNHQIIDGLKPLNEGDTIALLPPFSGG